MKIKLPAVLAAIIIAVFLLFAYLAFFQKKAVAPSDFTVPTNSPQVSVPKPEDEALKNALNLYIAKKQAGVDFKSGLRTHVSNSKRTDVGEKPS